MSELPSLRLFLHQYNLRGNGVLLNRRNAPIKYNIIFYIKISVSKKSETWQLCLLLTLFHYFYFPWQVIFARNVKIYQQKISSTHENYSFYYYIDFLVIFIGMRFKKYSCILVCIVKLKKKKLRKHQYHIILFVNRQFIWSNFSQITFCYHFNNIPVIAKICVSKEIKESFRFLES